LALLAGCSSAPDYKKPQVAMPAAWQSTAPFVQGTPADHIPKGQWWVIFQDPQLNQLEQQAMAQNQTLQVAAARLEQARA
ncbi:RND transporter, partial [Mucilaginibacter sp. 5C4]|nr:RND transporter [Mucilaginibacter sp. 5C4]